MNTRMNTNCFRLFRKIKRNALGSVTGYPEEWQELPQRSAISEGRTEVSRMRIKWTIKVRNLREQLLSDVQQDRKTSWAENIRAQLLRVTPEIVEQPPHPFPAPCDYRVPSQEPAEGDDPEHPDTIPIVTFEACTAKANDRTTLNWESRRDHSTKSSRKQTLSLTDL